MTKRKSKAVPKGFRSAFEYDVSQKLQPCGFSYEPGQIHYEIPRKYTPDFVYDNEGQVYYIECKGYFRAGDTQKYAAINRSLGPFEELIFVLMKPNQKVSKSTKILMSEWCDKHRIPWYTIETLDDLIHYTTKVSKVDS